MTTLRNYKEELIANLRDKEYRDAFVSSHIDNGIPFQIRTLREQRGWTQEELAKSSKKKQEAICRLENPNYGSLTLATLKELASAFDIALIVRFVPFGELVEWDAKLSSESLEVLSYDQDPYFHEKEENVAVVADREEYTVTATQEASSNVVFMKDHLARKTTLSSSQEIPISVASHG